ncbi:MAG: hypothetical protein KatS3mg002_1694 [Candidatus Woesearchaeota archaeon]|nr:MAG: hypothetical protein KatS3mg002_1694 [Candidatus Woesearchaeota archaeon]GIX40436.1 MAG: hypothetical protein KatS3mg129_0169 [Leptospiraceae bacterium]
MSGYSNEFEYYLYLKIHLWWYDQLKYRYGETPELLKFLLMYQI